MAHALHLLHPLAPADVVHQHLQAFGLLPARQKGVEFYPDWRSIPGAQAELCCIVLKLLHIQSFQQLGTMGLVFRHYQFQRVALMNLMGLVTQHAAEVLIHLEHAAGLDIHLNHTHGGLLAHGMKACIALLAGLRADFDALAPAPAGLPPARDPGGQQQTSKHTGGQHQPRQYFFKLVLTTERGPELQRPDPVMHLYLPLQRFDQLKLLLAFSRLPQFPSKQCL